MNSRQPVILGEFPCKLDQRWRLSVPGEMVEALMAEVSTADSPRCVLAKERPGCLSLWKEETWQSKLAARIDLAKQKVEGGLWDDQLGRVQLLGRLLSTRHQEVELAGRGRLLIPRSFRPFLGVEPEKKQGQVMVVGAAVCVEIWNPEAWLKYLQKRMPKFRRLLQELS